MDENGLIFLSYASPDFERVHEFYRALIDRGLNPWLDKEKLVPGQNWNFEIKRALGRATIIVAFLSENSVNRRGYVQREIRIALDQAQSKLHDDIYIIPVMLDSVPIPAQFEEIQILRDSDDPHGELVNAIEVQFQRLELENARLQGDSGLRWSLTWYRDKWDGLPGYDFSCQVPRFTSEQYPQASDISDVIRGWAISSAMEMREAKFSQSPDFFSFGQHPGSRTNSWEAGCSVGICEQVVSISYPVWLMGAAAAHPNMFFKTFAFTLDPVCQIPSLESLFSDPDTAITIIQNRCRHQLLNENERMSADEPDGRALDEEWVVRGTATWNDFSSFTFADDAIELTFAAYQVGCYADGPQFARIPYDQIATLIHRHYAFALGIEHMQRGYPISLPSDPTPQQENA